MRPLRTWSDSVGGWFERTDCCECRSSFWLASAQCHCGCQLIHFIIVPIILRRQKSFSNVDRHGCGFDGTTAAQPARGQGTVRRRRRRRSAQPGPDTGESALPTQPGRSSPPAAAIAPPSSPAAATAAAAPTATATAAATAAAGDEPAATSLGSSSASSSSLAPGRFFCECIWRLLLVYLQLTSIGYYEF